MARLSKPQASSDEPLSSGGSSSEEEEPVNHQINEEEDEEELVAVARSASSPDDEEVADQNQPDSDEDPAADEDADEEDQDGDNVDPQVSKREKARLREMQKMKKQKVQEILDAQNSAIDADMKNMVKIRWLILVTLLCTLSFSYGRELKDRDENNLPKYNHTLATILVQYSSAVYLSDLTELFSWTCSRCDGLTEGFEIIELVVDVEHCLQAFVGVAEDPHAIIIAFRGTNEHSLQNWIEDLYWKQHDINYPGMDDAMVHRGFYTAYHNTTIRPAVLDAIERAKKFYGNIQIIVTGHSMGGAMASFCGLDLMVNQHEKNVQVMTFGQPRVGNAAFSSLYSTLVPNTIRVTHDHDIVPHLPPYYYYLPQKTYHHFPREVWLYNIGLGSLVYRVEKICDGSGEDPSCSRSVSGNSIADHLVYYGIDMGSDEPSSCRIVMSFSDLNQKIRDSRGNIILTREPGSGTSLLKLNRDFDNQEYTISVI